MAQIINYAGIDISKDRLEVALSPAKITLTVANDRHGYARLVRSLRQHNVCRVGFEASGGYELSVMYALAEHGFEVIRHNAHAVRMFAKSLRRLAKNDQADALTIAEFTEYRKDAKPTDCRRDLDPLIELVRARSQYKEWKIDCDNRLEHTRDASLRRMIQQQRRVFEAKLALLDKKIAELISANDVWRCLDRQLQSAKGIASVTSHVLIARLPELGHVSRRRIASLSGLAPFDHDSGKHKGERHIAGGRSDVRAALYMAALSARTWNPQIAALARRLKGKEEKVIMTACMRKLLVTLNAMVRDGTDWHPQPAMA